MITPSINVHYAKVEGKIVSIKKISDYSGMKQYTGTYLATDIATRRSVSCIINEYNQVAFAWKENKQRGVSHSTNKAEARAFFEGIKRTKVFKQFFESLGMAIKSSLRR